MIGKEMADCDDGSVDLVKIIYYFIWTHKYCHKSVLLTQKHTVSVYNAPKVENDSVILNTHGA